jgi:hypothetical protein
MSNGYVYQQPSDWMKLAKHEIATIRLRYKKILDNLENLTSMMNIVLDAIKRIIPEMEACDSLWCSCTFKSNEYDTLVGTPGFDENHGGHRVYIDADIQYIGDNECFCEPNEFANVRYGSISIRTYYDSLGSNIDTLDVFISYNEHEKCYKIFVDDRYWNPSVDKYNWDETMVHEGETRATFKQEDINKLVLLKSELQKLMHGEEVIITDDTHIKELGFHIKVFNMLMRCGLINCPYNVGQLKNLTINEVSSITGMGPFYLINFLKTINKWGIELRKEEESE